MAIPTNTDGGDMLRPVEERLHVIDAIRAVALYGVVTFNILGMVAALVGNSLFPKGGRLDGVSLLFDLILVQGKARSAFALLFGVGFGLLMSRPSAVGRAFVRFHMRRMIVLLMIGLFNLTCLFFGDILILYALLGMVLLLFRNWNDRSIVRLGIGLVLVPSLVVGTVEVITGMPMPNLAGLTRQQADAVFPASTPAYTGTSAFAYVQANLRYYLDHYTTDTSYAIVYDLNVLGLFLLGLWIARHGVLADVERWRPLLRRVAWICLPLGLVLSLIHATRRIGLAAHGPAYALVTAAYVGLPIMAFGYVAALALFFSRRGQWLQRALSPMGRMALTGYLGSNAIGSFVWYGWGLGRMGDWNAAAINLFALTTYVALCIFSAGWLSICRFGPAEWLWRSLTYGRRQPLLRRSTR